MFLNNNCHQFILIVTIAVHFVSGFNDLNVKTNDENLKNSSSDNLVVESTHTSARLLSHLPSPIYVPLESKKSKKSMEPKNKYEDKKKSKYEDEEEDDDDHEEEYKGKTYQQNPYIMPRAIIKYVPIPIFLSKPKPVTTPSPLKTVNSLTMDDLLVINMAMKPKLSTNSGAKNPMSMRNTGNDYNNAMPMAYKAGYNPMGMTGGSVGNYGSINSGGYQSLNTGGGIHTNSLYGIDAQTYEQNDCGEEGSSQGRECEPYEDNGYENMSYQNQYEPNNSLDDSGGSSGSGGSSNDYDSGNTNYSDNYGSNVGNTGYQNNNYSMNESLKQTKNKRPKTSIKYSKRLTTTTTTTEGPYIDVRQVGSAIELQNNQNMSKAKQIAQVLEMLEKLN